MESYAIKFMIWVIESNLSNRCDSEKNVKIYQKQSQIKK